MSLFAIGDLHLHYGSELKAKGQLKGAVWRNHEELFRKRCEEMIRPDDTLVLAGDHSWGRNMSECEKDMEYICSLPGKKILLRGNHDMFWDPKKTGALNRLYAGKLFFLQNNYAVYKDYAIVGTKGYTFEGPFCMRGQRIVDWDRAGQEHADKLVTREAERLKASFEAARSDGFSRFIMFLHYPPTNIMEKSSIFTEMAESYNAGFVIYAHCHGETRFHDSLEGRHNGITYCLVSGDYLRWNPLRLL